jgi:hypothetical protein
VLYRAIVRVMAMVALLVAFAVLPSLFAPISPALAGDPSPRLYVSPSDDPLAGGELAPGATLTITVDKGTGMINGAGEFGS